MPESAK